MKIKEIKNALDEIKGEGVEFIHQLANNGFIETTEQWVL